MQDHDYITIQMMLCDYKELQDKIALIYVMTKRLIQKSIPPTLQPDYLDRAEQFLQIAIRTLQVR